MADEKLIRFFTIQSELGKAEKRKRLFLFSGKCCYRIRNEKRLMFFKAMPVPFATACRGSSAMMNLMPIFQ